MGWWMLIESPTSQTTREHRRVTAQASLLAPSLFRLTQSNSGTRLAKGKILVAATELGDSNFAETVVLLTEYNEEGAMGIILNRPTRVKLSELLSRIESIEQRDDPIFEGGPVERSEFLLLVRSLKPPEASQLIFGDVYLSSSADLLRRLAKETARQNAPFRVYSGYAGWAAGQLEAEVEANAWYILPSTSAMVFAARPEELWEQLIRSTTLRLAHALFGPPAA
jgi:putative transcriptional regulator